MTPNDAEHAMMLRRGLGAIVGAVKVLAEELEHALAEGDAAYCAVVAKRLALMVNTENLVDALSLLLSLEWDDAIEVSAMAALVEEAAARFDARHDAMFARMHATLRDTTPQGGLQ